MELNVKLFSTFKRCAPGIVNVFTISISSGTTIAQVLNTLNIPEDMPIVTLLNGCRAEANTQIESQSSLVVFPPISGG